MKKFLLLSLAALGMLAPSPQAEAYTNAQIAAKGKAYRTLLHGWDLSNNGGAVPYMTEGDVNVSLDPSTGYIKLSMSFDGSLIGWNDPIEMLIDVNGTTATIKYSAYVQPIGTGETERIGNTTYRKAVRQWFQMVTYKNVNGTNYYIGLIPRTFSYPTQNDTSGKQMTGTVSYDSESDTYTIDFGKFDLVYVHLVSNNAMSYYYDTNNDGSCNGTRYTYGNQNGLSYYNRDAVARHQGMSFTFYSPNATITDTKYDYNGRTKSNAQSRSYRANIRFDGDEFKIINWNNAGCPWYVDLDNRDQFYTTKEDFSIYFDPDILHTEVNPMEFAYGFTNTSNITTLYAQFYGTNFNSSTYDIDGVYCVMDHDVLHNPSNTNNWLDNKSNSTIIKIKAIDFDDYQIIQNPLFTDAGMSYKNYLENTVVNFDTPLDIDYTHQAGFNGAVKYGPVTWYDDKGNVSYEGNVLWVKGQMDDNKIKNSAYIDHYELHIIPGAYNNTMVSSYYDAETGLKGAMNISDEQYWTGYNPEYDAGHYNPKGFSVLAATDVEYDKTPEDEANDIARENSDGKFNRFITDDEMRAAGLEPDNLNQYSLFVKAVYTKESGLEPTFHGLTTYSDTFTTGVEDIIDNGASDEDAPVVYYNMNGVQMSGDNLTPGIYIKKQGNTTSKVVIR